MGVFLPKICPDIVVFFFVSPFGQVIQQSNSDGNTALHLAVRPSPQGQNVTCEYMWHVPGVFLQQCAITEA